MADKDIIRNSSSSALKGIVIGGIAGGLLYIIFNSFYRIPVLGYTWLGITLAIVIGAVLGSLYMSYDADVSAESPGYNDTIISNGKTSDADNNVNLKLREEQLDISKKKVPTSKVNIHKEFITEEKNITVPVTREELVIESTSLHGNTSTEGEKKEVIRIPVSDEDIDVSKHRVKLEDVSIYNHKYNGIKHVNETLKREKFNIKATGNAKVINIKSKKRKNP